MCGFNQIAYAFESNRRRMNGRCYCVACCPRCHLARQKPGHGRFDAISAGYVPSRKWTVTCSVANNLLRYKVNVFIGSSL